MGEQHVWGQSVRGVIDSEPLPIESSELMLDDLLHRVGVRLQLTETQHGLATARYESIADWFEREGSPIAAYSPHIYPQGSLKVGTTVRPIGRCEFDLDLVCVLQVAPQTFKNPEDALVLIEKRLQAHGQYVVMLDRKKRPRCVRVLYADDFHLDIVPACPYPVAGEHAIVVPDRNLQSWHPSNPHGFAAWFEKEAGKALLIAKADPVPGFELVERKAPLKRVVQLMKRWRDVAFREDPKLAPSSIVLTTLAATHYDGDASVYSALAKILFGIARSLPAQGRLVVLNPVSLQEDLSDGWDRVSGAYEAFCTRLSGFAARWHALSRARGIPAAAAILEELFDEEVGTLVKAQAQMIQAVRKQRLLGVDRRNVALRSVVASAGVVPVQRNTFYGD